MIKKINLLFVTFFGSGYIKIASGTFASLFTSISNLLKVAVAISAIKIRNYFYKIIHKIRIYTYF